MPACGYAALRAVANVNPYKRAVFTAMTALLPLQHWREAMVIWIVHRSEDGTLINSEKYTTPRGVDLGNAGIEIAHALLDYIETHGTVYLGDEIAIAKSKPRELRRVQCRSHNGEIS